MQPTRLNLQALRGEKNLRNHNGNGLLQSAADGPALSRRQLLGLVGAVAVTAAPGIATLGTTMLATFEIVGDRRRVALRLGGKDRWVIDTRRFAGSPTLSLEQDRGRINIALMNARYPGTTIPADFTCQIRPGLLGRQMTIHMALGGFTTTVPLERWLVGAESARGQVRLNHDICTLGTATDVALYGEGSASFFPDWTMRIEGNSIARMAGPGADAMANALVLTLLERGDATMLSGQVSRRTLLTMERGRRDWKLEPAPTRDGDWRFVAQGNPFDLIHIEAGEGSTGSIRHAMLAESLGDYRASHPITSRWWTSGAVGESSDDSGSLSVAPSAAMLGSLGSAFELPLRDVRYAVAFDPSGDQTAVLGRYGEDPVWLQAQGISLLVGDDAGSDRRFELVARNGTIERVDCVPAMHATFLHIAGDGVIAEPSRLASGTRLAFLPVGASPGDMANTIRFNPASPDDPPVVELFGTRVTYLRKEDLCVLTFEFVNMKVQTTGSQITTVPTGGGAYIIVHFQPQNIAEQAFFEDASSQGYPVKKPSGAPGGSDPDTGSSDDPLKTPPVNSRMAGPSRLVFKVPAGTAPIAMSLEGLLESCSTLELSVAGTALPPKESKLVYTKIKDLSGASLQIDKSSIYSANVGNVGKSTRVQKESNAYSLISNARSKTWEKRSTLGRALDAKVTAIENEIAIGSIGLFSKPKLAAPTPNQTAIEAPFRLIISPSKYGGWVHATQPVWSERTGMAELWHTRLAVRKNDRNYEGDEYEHLRTIRAIWTRDTDFNKDNPAGGPGHSNTPFRMSLDSADRHNLVHLTANYDLTKNSLPLPVNVESLMLTSLGAWMNVRGNWEPYAGSGLSVEEWRHRGTMGRDHYVRVVYKGYLFPFGHRASLVKVTERKFHRNIPGNVAYMRQRMFIVVREPEKFYVATNLEQNDVKFHLQLPFARVAIKTLVTPNLDDPGKTDLPTTPPAGGKLQSLFWPRVLNEDFQFHMVAEDFEGSEVEFTAPLLFVSSDQNIAYDETWMVAAKKDYETDGPEARRRRPMNGKRMMFAASSTPGDTSYETKFLTFGVEVPNNANYAKLGEDAPRFYPAVRSADVIIPAIKQLAGNDSVGKIGFTPVYLKNGFTGPNKGEVFAQLVGNIGLSFEGKGDKSGGLVKPNMSISGLSRTMGPVAGAAGVANVTSGNFKPDDFFGGGLGAKLFGVIDIWDVVKAVGLDEGIDLVPKFVTEAFTAVESLLGDLGKFKAAVDEVLAVPGMAADLQTALNNVKSRINTIITTDLSNIVNNLPSPPTDPMRTALVGDLGNLNTELGTLTSKLPKLPVNAANDARKQVENFITSLQKDLAAATDFVDKLFAALQLPEELKIRFEWKPQLKDWPASKPLFVTKNGSKNASFLIAAEAKAKTNFQSSPSFDVICSLQNFSIDLIAPVVSFMIIHFNRLEFFASAGKKADINVDMAGITFSGPLSFIETLKDLIPLDGFSDPPNLEITAKGITASFSIALPNVAIGVFSLTNLSLGAGFNIPFIGDPLTVWFNFCKRESPFNLTVSFLGGGGFFGLTLDPKGVHILEVALEFGASLSMDFGVASGGVHVMAGIYFKMEGDECTLTGYLRIGGNVEVLGIISVSIELNMSLTYESATGKTIGKATLTIEIEIFFFSISVEISTERKFAGSNGDPTFRQLMEPYYDDYLLVNVEPWKEYCEAFA